MSGHIERALDILRGSRYACQYNSEVAGRLDQIERELMLEMGEDPSVRESDEVRELFPRPDASRATAAARKSAEGRGIDVESVEGTGEDGRVLKADVEGFDLADEDE